MEVIPPDVRFAVGKMEGYGRNTFRLETSGATSASPGSIITLTMPSNAILDLRSFKVHLDVATTSDSSSTNTIYGKLPADASSLIQQMEVYCGGVQISQAFSEFNTVSKVKKLVHSSRDREGSYDGTLSHGTISTDEAVDNVSIIFKPMIGLFAESSTRYWPSSLSGDVTVRLTLASNAVLAYREATVAITGDFSDPAARTAAQNITYSVSNIHATIDTVSLGDAYESLLRDRLTREEFLPINVKEYYTFSLHGTSGTSHDVRFALSASSIDRLYTICRDGLYQTNGIRTRQYASPTFSDANVSNYFQFKSFNSTTSTRGSLRYQWQINSVNHPVYQADVLDAAHELLMISNQHGFIGKGSMCTSLPDFNGGKAIIPLQLQMAGADVSLQTGYNSRGSNSQFSVSLQGQVVPAADADAQVTAAISTMVICETTAQIRLEGMQSVSVAY
jgi:hypothetical protein